MQHYKAVAIPKSHHLNRQQQCQPNNHTIIHNSHNHNSASLPQPHHPSSHSKPLHTIAIRPRKHPYTTRPRESDTQRKRVIQNAASHTSPPATPSHWHFAPRSHLHHHRATHHHPNGPLHFASLLLHHTLAGPQSCAILHHITQHFSCISPGLTRWQTKLSLQVFAA